MVSAPLRRTLVHHLIERGLAELRAPLVVQMSATLVALASERPAIAVALPPSLEWRECRLPLH